MTVPDEIRSRELKADNARNNGQTGLAKELYSQLFAEADAASDYNRACGYLQQIGVCYKIDVSTDASLHALDRALRYADDHSLDIRYGNILRDVAITYAYEGCYALASEMIESSLNTLDLTDDTAGYAISLAKKGEIQRKLGMLNLAVVDISRAVKTLEETDAWFYLATAYLHQAALEINRHHFARALKVLSKAETLFNSHRETEPHERRYAQIWLAKALCLAKRRQHDKAKLYRTKAEAILNQLSPSAAEYIVKEIHSLTNC